MKMSPNKNRRHVLGEKLTPEDIVPSLSAQAISKESNHHHETPTAYAVGIELKLTSSAPLAHASGWLFPLDAVNQTSLGGVGVSYQR